MLRVCGVWVPTTFSVNTKTERQNVSYNWLYWFNHNIQLLITNAQSFHRAIVTLLPGKYDTHNTFTVPSLQHTNRNANITQYLLNRPRTQSYHLAQHLSLLSPLNTSPVKAASLRQLSTTPTPIAARHRSNPHSDFQSDSFLDISVNAPVRVVRNDSRCDYSIPPGDLPADVRLWSTYKPILIRRRYSSTLGDMLNPVS